jgi:hypothetical protein
VVVLKPGFAGHVSEQQIIDWAHEHMAAYKAPRIVQFADSLPKSGTAIRVQGQQQAHLALQAARHRLGRIEQHFRELALGRRLGRARRRAAAFRPGGRGRRGRRAGGLLGEGVLQQRLGRPHLRRRQDPGADRRAAQTDFFLRQAEAEQGQVQGQRGRQGEQQAAVAQAGFPSPESRPLESRILL